MMSGTKRRMGLLVAAVALCAPARAVDGHEIVGGWQGNGERGYAFVSPTLDLAGVGFLDAELLGRVSGSYLYYSFAEAGSETDVSSPGIGAGLALRWTGTGWTFTAGPGFEARFEEFERARPAEDDGSVPGTDGDGLVEGGDPISGSDGSGPEPEEESSTEIGATLQADLFYEVSPAVRLNGLVSHGTSNDYTWGRVGLMRQLTNLDHSGPQSWSVGVEGTAEGNDDQQAYRGGGVVELGLPRLRTSLQARAGGMRLTSEEDSEWQPFFGVGAFYAFR